MTDIVVLQTRLTEAETALHELSLGARAASVSYDGNSVTYTAANSATLRAYIAELKFKINGTPRRAIGVSF